MNRTDRMLAIILPDSPRQRVAAEAAVMLDLYAPAVRCRGRQVRLPSV
ncbi:MAG TPA: hypothetical protein VLJ14_17695 [Ktedonobacterales bacterium]|nr:hypothetical protein [Ktedonobacterales bacterium]